MDITAPSVETDVVFTLTLSNATGFSEATNIVVGDSLPNGYTFIGASGDGTYDDVAGQWTLASLAAGVNASLDITAAVLASGTYLYRLRAAGRTETRKLSLLR